jgi:hypothetical protein
MNKNFLQEISGYELEDYLAITICMVSNLFPYENAQQQILIRRTNAQGDPFYCTGMEQKPAKWHGKATWEAQLAS